MANRSSASLGERVAACYSGVVYDALRELGHMSAAALPTEIRLLKPSVRMAGPVFTVEGSCKPGLTADDSLLSWTRFLSAAPAGTIVVCQPNDLTIAHMGELSAETLQLRGGLGYLVDGGTRDTEAILGLDFPVACRYTTPLDIVGRWSVDALGQPLTIGEVTVATGDLLLVDRDGAIVVPRAGAAEVVDRAERLMATETDLRLALRSGEDPVEAYLRYGVF